MRRIDAMPRDAEPSQEPEFGVARAMASTLLDMLEEIDPSLWCRRLWLGCLVPRMGCASAAHFARFPGALAVIEEQNADLVHPTKSPITLGDLVAAEFARAAAVGTKEHPTACTAARTVATWLAMSRRSDLLRQLQQPLQRQRGFVRSRARAACAQT